MYNKALSSPIDQMIYVSFNQNASCFALGTEKGFKVFDSFNFGRDVHERVMDGGIGIVELYYRTNYIALVGGGKHPKYQKQKLCYGMITIQKWLLSLNLHQVLRMLNSKKIRL